MAGWDVAVWCFTDGGFCWGCYMIRDRVERLADLGSLPDEEAATEEQLEAFQALLENVVPPISNEEAGRLVGLFGPDECYGLAWTLLHLIETAPQWPLMDCLEDTQNEWIFRLRSRAERAITKQDR